jgi:hypothetical protein
LEVVRRPVGQWIPFEVTPYILHRIEFGRISREEERIQALHRSEERPGLPGTMGLEMIPEEDGGSVQLPQKMTEKFDHGFRVYIGIGMETEVEIDTVAGGSYTQRSDGRNLLVSAGSLVQDRGHTTGCPTASDQRGHQQTGLVEKNEEGLQAVGFF